MGGEGRKNGGEGRGERVREKGTGSERYCRHIRVENGEKEKEDERKKEELEA